MTDGSRCYWGPRISEPHASSPQDGSTSAPGSMVDSAPVAVSALCPFSFTFGMGPTLPAVRLLVAPPTGADACRPQLRKDSDVLRLASISGLERDPLAALGTSFS
ncbi:unnamed protein product [Tilletia controversa]|uniref:Uncharacterized protein n=3 Tax=Tilletia TaxID=13289 RepID=A0A8X7MID8_9BASI|nr:hypothetical protein CF328_g9122 [Tilletia controversa]KAE8182678.1 hypothetical protein CF335_g8558 [Tilletia laevis]KAE8247942.1 hypothetical protein A4X03_0g6917 [Tilletia caries]KAE8185496.1 hypothetical protein CF336_g7380 [Tilletia laevis]KAE8236953.1 hypothetical protein A4X06_0g9384 [Tilletia controversa]